MNRGLTKEEAERGVSPETLTKAEWGAMWAGSLRAEGEARQRHMQASLLASTRVGP